MNVWEVSFSIVSFVWSVLYRRFNCSQRLEEPILVPSPCVPLISVYIVGESVEISNRDLRLEFNDTGHLSTWTDLRTGVSHHLSHLYLQEAEKEGLDEENVCDGTNVYTFVPDSGRTVLTPKVYTYI